MSLIAHWKLNDDAASSTISDSAGSYSGTYNDGSGQINTSTGSTDGVFYKALDFDGSDEYVDITGTADDFESGNLTFSLWVNPDATTDRQFIACHYNWRFSTFGGKFRFSVGRMNDSSGPTYTCISDETFSIGSWYHLVGVYDVTNEELRFYVNGELQADTEDFGDNRIWTGYGSFNLRFGTSYHGATQYFNGQIDDVRIYDEAFDSDKASFLYLSLEAQYKLNDNATNTTVTDETGNHSGTSSSNTSTLSTTGKINDCFDFDGSSDWISIADDIGINLRTVYLRSYSMWVKLDDTSSRQVLWKEGGVSNSLAVYQESNKVYFTYADSGSLEGYCEATLNDNDWHHVVATFNSVKSRQRLFVDGLLKDTDNNSQSIGPHSGNISIAHRDETYFLYNGSTSATDDYLNGKLDDIRVYNKELNYGEICGLYYSGDGSEANSPEPLELTALLAHWKLDENNTTSSTIADSSGNGFDGTLLGLDDDFTSNTLGAYSISNSVGSSTTYNSSNDWVEVRTGDNLSSVLQKNVGVGRYGYAKIEIIKRADYPVDNNSNIKFMEDSNNYYRFFLQGSSYTEGIYKIVSGSNTDSDTQTGTLDAEDITLTLEFWWTPTSIRYDLNGVKELEVTDTNSTEIDVQKFYMANGQVDLDIKSIYIESRDSAGRSIGGKINSGLDFNRINEQVNFGNPFGADLTGDLSISFWVNADDLGAMRENPIAKAYGGEFAITFEDDPDAGVLSYRHGISGANSSPYTSFCWDTGIENGSWHHITIVRDISERTVRCYVDSVEKTDTSGADWYATSESSNDLTLCAGYVSNFNGQMDDVRIYAKALSQSEVNTLYAMGNPRRVIIIT